MPNQHTTVYTPGEKEKIKKGLCKVRFCRHKRRKGKTLCYKHLHDRAKELNPVRYFYDVLKGNARRRGKIFTLTFEQFKEFVERNNYMKLKGKSKLSLCIDCFDNEQGYQYHNIRTITLQQNSWKRNFVDYGNREEIECPF
jgi:hypothetical protein